MPKRPKGPPPSNVQRFRGGPWGGRQSFGTSAPPPLRVEVPADDPSGERGYYKYAARGGRVAGENAEAWLYDWVPSASQADDEQADGPDADDVAG